MDTIKYLRRVNLGNYEHEELEVTTAVKEGQDRTAAVEELREFVLVALNLKGSGSHSNTPKPEKVEAPKKEIEAKGETKVLKQKPLAEAKKGNEETQSAVAEAPTTEETVKADSGTNPTTEKKPEDSSKKDEKPKIAAKKETTIKVKASKATAYDRNLDTHKALLGQFLDKEFPTWRKPEELKKAGTASRALQGKDFQDGEGNILDAFKIEFRTYMA